MVKNVGGIGRGGRVLCEVRPIPGGPVGAGGRDDFSL